tara:strand:- start:1929 stop:2267 length:339 start_codon:yes stop_codon:yes gene_type:complete
MTALQTPAADAPAEEWGRLAVSIPGWRWMPGMIDTYPSFRLVVDYDPELDDLSDCVPDPDDPATAGCLLALLGAQVFSVWMAQNWREGDDERIGRACIAAAAALGRWPGGEG